MIVSVAQTFKRCFQMCTYSTPDMCSPAISPRPSISRLLPIMFRNISIFVSSSNSSCTFRNVKIELSTSRVWHTVRYLHYILFFTILFFSLFRQIADIRSLISYLKSNFHGKSLYNSYVNKITTLFSKLLNVISYCDNLFLFL